MIKKLLKTFPYLKEKLTQDRCGLMAASLTYYSLLSIVPIFAALFGFSQGFGLSEHLKRHLLEKSAEHRQVIEQLIEFSEKMILQTQEELIAGIGLLVLVFSVLRIWTQIELSMNQIWGIKKKRSFARRFSDYLAMSLICPLFFLIASSTTLYLSANMEALKASFSYLPIAPLLQFSIQLSPYLMIWLLFSFLYLFVPNGKVRWPIGIFAGFLAGSCYQVVQWLFIKFQVGLSSYGAIYGSFAALPLFLTWLQMSWLIVLAGVELSALLQKGIDEEAPFELKKLSLKNQKLLMLWVMHHHLKNFEAHQKPMSSEAIATKLEISKKISDQLHRALIEYGLLCKLEDPKLFLPSASKEELSFAAVLQQIEEKGEALPFALEADELRRIEERLEELQRLSEHSAGVPLSII